MAWRSTFQDGIWDIFFGWLMLGFGLTAFAEYIPLPEEIFVDWAVIAVILPWNLMAVLILFFGKKH
ncbi:MAG: hypothetical protein ACFFKA_05605, partial [Candidatus Thorarchaeota archaeon]